MICCFAASNLSLSSCVTVVPKLFSNSSNSLKAYKGEIKSLLIIRISKLSKKSSLDWSKISIASRKASSFCPPPSTFFKSSNACVLLCLSASKKLNESKALIIFGLIASAYLPSINLSLLVSAVINLDLILFRSSPK